MSYAADVIGTLRVKQGKPAEIILRILIPETRSRMCRNLVFVILISLDPGLAHGLQQLTVSRASK